MKIISKKTIILVILLLVLVLIGVIYFSSVKVFPIKKQAEKQPEELILNHRPCLSDNEVIGYDITEERDDSKSVVISIYNEDKSTKKFSFRVKDFSGPYIKSAFKCNVYIIREFNVDYIKGVPLKNFKTEFWRYHYDGKGGSLIILFKGEGVLDNFSSFFSIDPVEKYIVLERSYLGNPNYALVIKNLETKEDVFVLPLKEIVDKYPDLEGSIGFNEWTKNGKYFWGNIFVEANVLAFFRIERDTWKYEIFEAPKSTMGGDALNLELGYITYDDGPPWTGDLDWAKLYQEEWEKEGKIVSFYLYNLFTKEKVVLATTTDTMWYFKPKWISDTELEYYLPSGERKIFKAE